jgi:hypothetical protein
LEGRSPCGQAMVGSGHALVVCHNISSLPGYNPR